MFTGDVAGGETDAYLMGRLDTIAMVIGLLVKEHPRSEDIRRTCEAAAQLWQADLTRSDLPREKVQAMSQGFVDGMLQLFPEEGA